MRLRTKITLPFVALFAAVLVVLGLVLANVVFAEIEARVVREQRFMLFVATDPRLRIPLTEPFLRGIRDAAQGGDEKADGVEIVVLQNPGETLSTLEPSDPDAGRLLEELYRVARQGEGFPGLRATGGAEPTAQAFSEIQSVRASLSGEAYVVLYTSRMIQALPRTEPVRRDFLLLYPQRHIHAAQQRALMGLAALGGLGLFLTVLLGTVIAHFITRPIQRLARSAGVIASGGLDKPLDAGPSSARDEIGDLARALATMVESLRKSQEELLQSERLASTGKLAASVAHEIRNPLTSLRMTVQMLADKHRKNVDPAARDAQRTAEAYQIVLGEIDRLELAVDELLTFARPRPPRREPTDLNKLLRDTVRFLERQMRHARVEAVIEPDEALPADLRLDANKIRQLLVNLILNAMQAIVRDGAVTVRSRWDAAAQAVILEVADTGPGVPDDIREKLFDLFVSTKPGGGGLGLAIAKQVAEEHDGRITFDSTKNGTTFRVTLPASAQPAPRKSPIKA